MNSLFPRKSLKILVNLIFFHTLFSCGWEIPWVDSKNNPSKNSSGDNTNLKDDWYTKCTVKTSGGYERIRYKFTTEVYENDFFKVELTPFKHEKSDCSDEGKEEDPGTPFGYQEPTTTKLTPSDSYSQMGLLIFKKYRDKDLTYTCFKINKEEQMYLGEFKEDASTYTNATSCDTTGADSDKDQPRFFTAP